MRSSKNVEAGSMSAVMNHINSTIVDPLFDELLVVQLENQNFSAPESFEPVERKPLIKNLPEYLREIMNTLN